MTPGDDIDLGDGPNPVTETAMILIMVTLIAVVGLAGLGAAYVLGLA